MTHEAASPDYLLHLHETGLMKRASILFFVIFRQDFSIFNGVPNLDLQWGGGYAGWAAYS